MHSTKILTSLSLCSLLLAASWTSSQAQLATANWNNSGGDGLWNNAANWDISLPPGDGTNAVISSGNTVTYDVPMTAGDFGALTLNGVLNVNAAGFVSGSNGVAVTVSGSSARLFVNNGGVMSATNGGLTFASAGAGAVFSGGTLAVQGALRLGGSGSGNTGFMTNNGGNLSAASVSINPNNISSSSLLLINGGSNSLGNVTIFRSSSGSASFNALGSEGLIISNGLVNMTSVQVGAVGANSTLTMQVAGGIVTNSGTFIVAQNANNRPARYLQSGGLVVSTFPDGIRLAVTNGGQVGQFTVLGGTNIAEKFVLGDATNTATGVIVNFTNAANIYVGSGGIVTNNVNTINLALNNGGLFGAKADWSSPLPMAMGSGTFTFNAADPAGTAHNISLSARLSGPGVLNKAGAGTLTLNATNTYTGNTIVGNGTLALGPSAAYPNTSQIIISNGATLDVSGAGPATNLLASQKLIGTGTVVGNMMALAGAAVQPAGNLAAGTLTFAGSFTEAGDTVGGVVNNLDLSDDPTGLVKANDLISVAGDLTITGTNTVQVNLLTGTIPNGSVYKLFQYAGNFNGSVTNLILAGSNGVLTNDAVAKTISLRVSTPPPPPTNVVWIGNAVNNNWDNTSASTNWFNGTALVPFVSGDSVRFDAAGAANPVLTLAGSLNPSNVVVDAATDYTFTGVGTLDGVGGLIKTNTGKLSIQTLNNNYPGATVIGGGILEAAKLANGGAPSSLGAAGNDPANLVLLGTTLRYLGGNASSDRGATLEGATATIEVTNSATTLTLSGLMTGPATLVKAGRGTLTLTAAANSPAGGTVISNGVLQLNTVGAGGTVGITNQGATLKLGSAFALVNVVDFEGNCTVDLGNVSGDSELNGAWSGSGNVTVVNQQTSGRTFTVGGNGNGGGNLLNFYGSISMGTNMGTLRFNDGGGNPNLGSTNVAIDLGTGSATLLVRNGGVTIDVGSLAGGPNTRLLGRASGNSGTVTYSIGGLSTSALFAGIISNSAAGNLTAITKVGAGTWTLGGSNFYTGSTIVANGTLAFTNLGSIDHTPTISMLTNAAIASAGRTDGTLTLPSGQTLQGSGTILGSLTAQNGSTMTVGDDANIPETMTITNVLTLQSGCTLNMDVDHYQYAGALTNDAILGLAHVTYGGTLALNVLSVETNSVFKLFSATNYSGAFDSINPAFPPLSPAVWEWDTSYLTVDGTLRVTALRPKIGTVDFSTLSSGTITLNALNGSPGTTVNVLTTTNLALPVASWITNTTTSFDGNGALTGVSITVDPTAPQLFMQLQQLP